MTKITMKAEVRKIAGHKVKTLRASGLVPANVYGKNITSRAVQIDSKEFKEIYKKAGETGIIELSLGKETLPVLVGNVQLHPATNGILHVDFRQVNLKEKVVANIPVTLVGESPAEKSGIGTVVVLVQELEVEALPTDLPEKFEVDASKLGEVDQTVAISDLKVGNEVEIKASPDTIIAKVEPPQKEEVIPVVQPTAEATENATEAAAVQENTEEKSAEESKA